MNFLVLLLTIILIIAITLVIFKNNHLKSAFNPNLIYGIYWLINVSISFFLINNYGTFLIGNIYILFSILFFYLGSLTIKQVNTNIECKNEYNKSLFGNKKIVIILLLFTMIGYFNFYSTVSTYNIKISSLFNIDYLSYINNKIAVDRYNGNYSNSIFKSITLIFIYLSPLIGGYVYNRTNKKRFKFLAFLTLTPAFLVVLLENTKAVLIYAVFLFLSSFLADKLAISGRKSKINFKKIAVAIIILLLLLFFSMILRVGRVDIDVFKTIYDKFIHYATGHIEAFNKWFNIRDKGNYTYGQYTFYSFFDILNISAREQGVYDVIEDGVSNIFTTFRGLISDFGVIGSFVFLFIFGFMSNKAYVNVATKSSPKIIYRVFLTFVYFTILVSFLISSLTYVSITIAFIFYCFLIYFLEYKVILFRRN